MMGAYRVQRKWLWGLCILGLFAVIAIYALFNPEESRWFPKCVFMQLTGLKCPGCGSQRAVHALLHGDIAAALRYNAMLTVLIPFIIALAVSEMWPQRFPHLNDRLHRPWISLTMLLLMLIWGIGRNFIAL